MYYKMIFRWVRKYIPQILVIIMLVTLSYTVFRWLISPSVTSESVRIACYENNTNNNLPSIRSENVPKDTSFFFLETSCHDTYLRLTARQLCAIESAALLNPSSNVYLLIPSPIREPERFDQHTKILLESYKNIKFLHINMSDFFKSTPLQEWYAEGKLKTSRWPVEHASDVLRYTTIWKYGGIYADLDMVFLKSLEGLSNFAGVENYTTNVLSSCLFSFTHGHPVSDITIRDIKDRFDGSDWGNNGPGVITRALKEYCAVSEVSQMDQCTGITVYPPKVFTPIPWRNLTIDIRNIEADIKESLAVHFWNHLSHDKPELVGLRQLYYKLAAKFCPQSYLPGSFDY